MSATWNNGDRVLGWRSGEALWYPGTVKGADGDRFILKFDDGRSAQVPADQLRPVEIEPGTRLQANWEGMGTWYSGVVDRKDGDKLAIKYADGDEETVEVGRVRLSGKVPPSVRPCLVLTNPEAEDGAVSLVRLTAEWLTLAPVPKEDLATTARELPNGGTVSGQIISLASLVKLEGGEDEADLTITAREDGKTTTATVQFASSGAREGFLGALLEQAGPAWKRHDRKVRRWSTALWMLAITAAVAGATWFFYFEASHIAAGRNPLLHEDRGSDKSRQVAAIAHWVERVIGPTGVLIVGGLALAVCAFFWFGALTYPPAHVVFEREGLS
jgi:hypothetical protein